VLGIYLIIYTKQLLLVTLNAQHLSIRMLKTFNTTNTHMYQAAAVLWSPSSVLTWGGSS